MGSVQQAVLEFDGQIQAPWRPRLVSGSGPDAALPVRPPLSHPSRRSPSRVGVSRPPAPGARPTVPVRQATSRHGERPPLRGGAPSSPQALPRRASAPGRPPVAAPVGSVRLRLTRRARRLAVVLAMAAGVAVGSWLGPLLGAAGGDLRLAGDSSVVVQSGDTLWSIASSLDGDGDVRALIDEIQELNGLRGSELRPGQTLLLP